QQLQPPFIDDHIVVSERDNLTRRLAKARVQRVRLSRLLFEQIPEAAWVAQNELGNDFGCLVARVVVHHKHFPTDRRGHTAPGEAFERPRERSAPVKGADDNGDVHDRSGYDPTSCQSRGSRPSARINERLVASKSSNRSGDRRLTISMRWDSGYVPYRRLRC